jgi:hypothetical protein
VGSASKTKSIMRMDEYTTGAYCVEMDSHDLSLGEIYFIKQVIDNEMSKLTSSRQI